jgi:hypothetical protein
LDHGKGGGQRIDEVVGDEVRLAIVGPIELRVVDQALDGLTRGQVGLQQPAEERVLRPSWIAEAGVAAVGLALGAADRDPRELPD